MGEVIEHVKIKKIPTKAKRMLAKDGKYFFLLVQIVHKLIIISF